MVKSRVGSEAGSIADSKVDRNKEGSSLLCQSQLEPYVVVLVSASDSDKLTKLRAQTEALLF